MPIFRRIANMFSRARVEREIDAELKAHIEMRTEDSIAAGMSAREARRDALVRFGNPVSTKERVIAIDAALVLGRIGRDIRYALRQLRKNPAFSVTVILSVALGVGANTAMFSVIHAVLLQPLGYGDPDRLVLVGNGATPIRYEEMSAAARSYTGLGAYSGREDLAISGDGQPEVLRGARVSGNFLDILGVRPLLGRSFYADEDKPGAPDVAMISAELWKRRFGAELSIVGRSLTLAGASYTIIGVLPARFHFPSTGTDVWLARPSEWSVIDATSRPLSPILHMFGRLKPGVTLQQANEELTVIDRQYDVAHPGMLDGSQHLARLPNRPPDRVALLKDELVSDIRPKLWMLFGVVGFVLLIVCANIASLLLARATARSREFAVRAAIGAGRGRILAQLLTESVLLALMGGVLGAAFAELAIRGIQGMKALDLPRVGEIHMDGAVLVFAAALSLITGLTFGLWPAFSASRPDLTGVLRGSGEGAGSGARPAFLRFHARSVLVVGQVALSLILLIGATLLIESLARAYRVDPGFQASNVLTMRIAPSPTRYDTVEKRFVFYDAIIGRVESLPGVSSAAITRTLPMSGWAGAPVEVVGRPEMKLNERPIAVYEDITPGYFKTMRIALKRGRVFTAADNAEAAPVAIIDEGMARHFWPQYPGGTDPVGQYIRIGSRSPPTEIVGVVAEVRQSGLDSDPRFGVYVASAQRSPESGMLAVRTAGDPLLLTNTVRAQILALDPDQPVSDVASMNEVVDASEGQLRVMMMLLAVFAGVATLIAVVGLYGVVAYSVAQRTKEMGIRRALGAERGNIVSLVVGQGLRLTLAGVVLGVCGALSLTRVLQGLLFHTSTTDPMTYAGIACLFVVVAAVAAYFPALRAASVDPMQALRNE
jgi:putative ABC transport system permease protein